MKKLVLSLIAVVAIAFSANAANYKVDNNAIDNIIENATEVVTLEVATPAAANLPAVEQKVVKPVTALILNFLVGCFGVHRHYMGTAPGMWALYTFTFGGIFGIVDLVDFIMLIIGTIDNDISKYINNRKFFMWA
ncbi:MAG: TM2 domain-containing protein [Bacteroidales bacterium]|nr:TM2 domain-containing protein [Bacteroidales bacterium]